MSTFYGTVIGNRETPATRCGSRASGITTAAQSWDGSVITRLTYDESGELMVELRTSPDSSARGCTLLFYGTLEELRQKLA